jgi:preprotein translocase subunit SecF
MIFITYRKYLVAAGLLLTAASIAIIAFFGLRLGIDFTGGSLTEVSYQTAPEKLALEESISTTDLGSILVRESVDEAGKPAYLIRTRDLTEVERASLEAQVVTLGEGGEVTRFTSIGPVIGQELKDKAVYAIGGVVIIIVLYVAFAFAGIGTPISSWIYGLVTIFVLLHDVLIPTAVMALLGQYGLVEVDTLFVMALLAVLGYSVNDTIVIFDRVRENLIKNRTEHKTKRTEPGGITVEEVTYTLTAPYDQIVGAAVKESMARSINTSLTTMIALAALYFFGGAVTQTFALVLFVGVLAGTYSSICIASPMVVLYADWKAKRSTRK